VVVATIENFLLHVARHAHTTQIVFSSVIGESPSVSRNDFNIKKGDCQYSVGLSYCSLELDYVFGKLYCFFTGLTVALQGIQSSWKSGVAAKQTPFLVHKDNNVFSVVVSSRDHLSTRSCFPIHDFSLTGL